MTAIQDYQYGPLANDGNTRFIQLYPAAHFEDPIRVDIIERAYDASKTQDPVSYEALSYAWGSDEDSAYIFVGGELSLAYPSQCYPDSEVPEGRYYPRMYCPNPVD